MLTPTKEKWCQNLNVFGTLGFQLTYYEMKVKIRLIFCCIKLHKPIKLSFKRRILFCRQMASFSLCINQHRVACWGILARLVQYSTFEKIGLYICQNSQSKAGYYARVFCVCVNKISLLFLKWIGQICQVLLFYAKYLNLSSKCS